MRERINKTELIKLMLILTILFLIQSCATISEIRNYTIRNNLDIEMIFVEGGTFRMGDVWGDGHNHEKPVHTVSLSNYYLSETEVTNAQFCEFLNEIGNQEEEGYLWLDLDGEWFEECLIEEREGSYYPKSGYAEHPVIFVNWYGAKAFCEWLSDKTGDEYRLPTEAEWEYAARSCGSEVNRYAGIDDLEELYLYSNFADVNFDKEFVDEWDWGNREYDDGYIRTAPVGNYRPNDLGLYNMSGNVCEWCSDCYGEDYYENSPVENPTGPLTGIFRVARGGSWNGYPWVLRCSIRFSFRPENNWVIGFRICREGD